MILTIVATVSERHAPPSHANTKHNTKKKTGYFFFYSYEEVRVLHIYISIILIRYINHKLTGLFAISFETKRCIIYMQLHNFIFHS